MGKALQKHIIAAVDDVYVKAKKNRASGYNKVTINQLLIHLFTQYGEINPKDLANNEKRFIKPWDSTEPFENIIDRFDNCIEFAKVVLSLYTPTQMTRRYSSSIKMSTLTTSRQQTRHSQQQSICMLTMHRKEGCTRTSQDDSHQNRRAGTCMS
jgi:hypothetical protein